MTNERPRNTASHLSRRTLLTALPASGMALALPAVAEPAPNPEILGVIEELEAWQGWEASCVIAAKAHAAYRMREALGLDLPDPEYHQLHLHYQKHAFTAYQRTVLYRQDLVQGKAASGKTGVPAFPA